MSSGADAQDTRSMRERMEAGDPYIDETIDRVAKRVGDYGSLLRNG